MCAVDGCGRRSYCRGWCAKHYQRWKVHGSPHAYRPNAPTVVERFWAKVARSTPEACWTWSASLDEKGYGQFHDGRRSRKAHDVAYEIVVGLVPPGLELDHLCRNRRCVNPAHLEPVTHQENTRRAAYSRSVCAKGHILPPPGKNGRRVCRPCANERSRRHRASKAIYEKIMG